MISGDAIRKRQGLVKETDARRGMENHMKYLNLDGNEKVSCIGIDSLLLHRPVP